MSTSRVFALIIFQKTMLEMPHPLIGNALQESF
jgi:hypothetical protein